MARRNILKLAKSVGSQPPPVPSRRGGSIYLRPEDLRSFQNLLFAARHVVEGVMVGKHRSPFKGTSPEFVEYRSYNPGDPVSAIDWKVYARTDRDYIRLTQKETDLPCYIFIDGSGSMGYGGPPSRSGLLPEPFTKYDYACYLSAALAYMMIKQGDKVGLTLFTERRMRQWPIGGTFSHLYGILNALENRRPNGDAELGKVLEKAAGSVRRKGLLVVVSDFYGDHDEIFNRLGIYLHRGFEVLLFHVMHETEYRLPDMDAAQFVDMETDEILTCNPRELSDAYNQRVEEFIDGVRSRARSRGIDYNFAHTGTPYHEMLRNYMTRRRAL